MTDDLFRPTLSREDDRHGFQNPWNPANLMWTALFGGVLASGILILFNDKRLGLPSRARWLAPVILVIWVATIVLAVNMTGFETNDSDLNRSLGRNYRIIIRVVSLVVAWVMLIPQRRRFTIFATGEQEAASLWKPALGAILASWAVNFLVMMAVRSFTA